MKPLVTFDDLAKAAGKVREKEAPATTTKPASTEKFDQNKYINQYKREHYERISVYFPKDKHIKERVKAVAEQQHISIAQFIINAIEKELEWYK